MLKMLNSSINECGKRLGNEFLIWQLQLDKAILANNWNIVVQFPFLAIIQKSDNIKDLRNKDYYSPGEEIRKQQLNIQSLGLVVTKLGCMCV